MAKAKKAVSDKKEKVVIPKEKKTGLFDLISYLTDNKKQWKDLTFEEQKNFNPFIINRFLSMNLYFTNLVAELQKYVLGGMTKQDMWTLYYHMLPAQKLYLSYVKAQIEPPTDDLVLLQKHYGVSKRECEDYWLICNNSEEEKNKLTRLHLKYKELS
jgi:hypothetical protein